MSDNQNINENVVDPNRPVQGEDVSHTGVNTIARIRLAKASHMVSAVTQFQDSGFDFALSVDSALTVLSTMKYSKVLLGRYRNALDNPGDLRGISFAPEVYEALVKFYPVLVTVAVHIVDAVVQSAAEGLGTKKPSIEDITLLFEKYLAIYHSSKANDRFATPADSGVELQLTEDGKTFSIFNKDMITDMVMAVMNGGSDMRCVEDHIFNIEQVSADPEGVVPPSSEDICSYLLSNYSPNIEHEIYKDVLKSYPEVLGVLAVAGAELEMGSDIEILNEFIFQCPQSQKCSYITTVGAPCFEPLADDMPPVINVYRRLVVCGGTLIYNGPVPTKKL